MSSFTLNADLCFSIGNLTRVPPSTLQRELLSLVLHEATHLGGAGESEAVYWQQEFNTYFGERFGELVSNTETEKTFKLLGEARTLLTLAQTLADKDPKNPRIFEAVGKIKQNLFLLPDHGDSLALELKLNPTYPDMIPIYSKSVMALIGQISFRFETEPFRVKIGGAKLPIDFLPPDQVILRLNEFSEALFKVNESFLAFIGMVPISKPLPALLATPLYLNNFAD